MMGGAGRIGRALLRSPIRLFIVVWVGACVAAGCASPRENLYTLESTPGEAVKVAPAAAAPAVAVPTVVVGPVSIPQLVDRPQLVIHTGPSHVDIAEQERWAVPLKESLPRMLAGELGRLVPTVRFVEYSSAAINAPSARLSIEIRRFDVQAGSGATIEAHWIYRPSASGTRATEGDATIHEPITEAGYEGFVNSLRRACVGLARSMAERLGAQRSE